MASIPVPAEMPGVAGIFIGGCVDRGEGSRFRARAHAHNHSGANYGWICFLSEKRVFTAGNKPSRILWHEYAHILTPKHGHDDAWRATMKNLGQPLPARYKKAKRPKHTRWGPKVPVGTPPPPRPGAGFELDSMHWYEGRTQVVIQYRWIEAV
jgi:hypothetical protein